MGHGGVVVSRAGESVRIVVRMTVTAKAVPKFCKLVGDEQEPAPEELEEHDRSDHACAS